MERPFELEHGELVLTTSAAGYFQKGISVGKIVKTLDVVYVKPFAKVSDSIYVNVLIFDFKNILE
jgi:cell shape-determining protein MreC